MELQVNAPAGAEGLGWAGLAAGLPDEDCVGAVLPAGDWRVEGDCMRW